MRLFGVAVAFLIFSQPCLGLQLSIVPVSVPFEILPTKHIAVKVRVNGHGPYRLLFDTGSPIVLLSGRVAKDCGRTAPGAGGGILAMMAGETTTGSATLEAGGLRVGDVPVVFLDHPSIQLLSELFGRVDGIVGFPFFARFRTTIDYQSKYLTFAPNGFHPPDLIQSLTRDLSALMEDQHVPRRLASAGQWGIEFGRDQARAGPGVAIARVLPSSAAQEAGLVAGDRLLSVGARWTDSFADAVEAAGHAPPGIPTCVVVQRGGKSIALTVRPRDGS